MEHPTVCAIMLTRDRPEMARRAVECFFNQTYPFKKLVVFDTGTQRLEHSHIEPGLHWGGFAGGNNSQGQIVRRTIGDLRNAAICHSPEGQDQIIIHWDDDDWSHPSRIAEQVALLQASGADAVGYNEMPFWREPYSCAAFGVECLKEPGQAWIYRGTILGTSLCYWRSAWERRPFEAKSRGEDTAWLQGVKSVGRSSLWPFEGTGLSRFNALRGASGDDGTRMIAGIHAGNTSDAYDPKSMLAAPHHWRRAPEWDKYCAEAMRL